MLVFSPFIEPSQERYNETFYPQSLSNNHNNSTFSCATSPLISDYENKSFENKNSTIMLSTGSDCENELPHSTTISTGSECENEIPLNKKFNDKEFKEAKRVKKLLSLFPPPCTAEEFFHKNPPSVPDGNGKVKRPCNKFIIFRKVAHDQKKKNSKLMNYNERTFSKYIGFIWNHLTSDEKNYYTKLASKVKELHQDKNPLYKYKPKRDKAIWKQYSPSSKQKRKTKSQQPVYSQIDDININVQQIQSTQEIYDFELPVEEFNNQNQYIVSDNIQNQYIDSDNIQNQYISNDIQDDNIQYTNNYYFY